MMLETVSTAWRDASASGVVAPFLLHPVEVRQLRLRQEELAEEASLGALGEDRETVAIQLAHVREILGHVERGIASATRRAGLAA